MASNFKYYPAIMRKESDIYFITFPDVEGCKASGGSIEEVCSSAYDALRMAFYKLEAARRIIPEASDIEAIEIPSDEHVILIPFDEEIFSKEVKKSIAIPKWLEVEAKRKGINLSDLFRNALEQKLGII